MANINDDPYELNNDLLGYLKVYLRQDLWNYDLYTLLNNDGYRAELELAIEEMKKNDAAGYGVLTDQLRLQALKWAFVTSGAGGYFNQVQTFLSSLDRFKSSVMLPINRVQTGYTFITRPRLCLQSSNLRNNRRFAPLDTLNPTSLAFMIRCLLDTNLGKVNDYRLQSKVEQCPLIDVRNPFLTPLCNSLIALNNLPDMMIQTQTTEGGYQQEAQTFAVGGDDFNRANHSLNLEFKDIQHGPVSAIIYYWLEYIRCVTRGIMLAYADDIDEQRLNYTVSIYRFAMDPTRTYIVDWCKCTGCFPTSLNTGSMLQVYRGEEFVEPATTLTVNFACNKIEYRDYAVLMDFNALMERYCPDINKDTDNEYAQPDANDGINYHKLVHPNLPKEPYTNFRGLPYITTDMHGIRLEFRRTTTPVFPYEQSNDLIDQLMAVDLLNKAEQFDRQVYDTFANFYTPEYAAFYQEKGSDLGASIQEFINQVIKNPDLNTIKGFDII